MPKPCVPTVEGSTAERRTAALAPLRVVAADVYVSFDLAEAQNGWRYGAFACEGSADLVTGRLAIEGLPFVGPWNPATPRPAMVNCFRPGIDALGSTHEQLAEHAIWREHYGPFGLRWERRMLVYEGDRFHGWIGLTRCEDAPRFSRAEDAALERVAKRVRRLVIAESTLRNASCPSGQAFVTVRPDGSIEGACAEAARWLTPDHRSMLAAVTRRLDLDEDHPGLLLGGVLARPVRLGGEGSARYLWVLSAARRPRRSAAARLSPRVREVAELALKATVPEIARSLGISAHTVRDYIKCAYQELGVASRVELAEALVRQATEVAADRSG